MQPAAGTVRLTRNLYGRLVGGARLQGLVTLLVILLAGRAARYAAGVTYHRSLSLAETLIAFVALGALMLIGATGWASVDDTGVQWRYYTTHRYSWSEIEQAALVVKGVSLASVRHTIELRVHGRRHVVTPAVVAGRDRFRFGRDVLARAAAHASSSRTGGVAARVSREGSRDEP